MGGFGLDKEGRVLYTVLPTCVLFVVLFVHKCNTRVLLTVTVDMGAKVVLIGQERLSCVHMYYRTYYIHVNVHIHTYLST